MYENDLNDMLWPSQPSDFTPDEDQWEILEQQSLFSLFLLPK